MGDIADWIIEEGEMADLWDNGYYRGITCKYCGKNGLRWENLGTQEKPKWRLFNSKGIHLCIKKEA